MSRESAAIFASRLQVDGASDPIALEPSSVRFSWRLGESRSGKRGLLQSAYRIRVLQDRVVVWDSGKVGSLVPWAAPVHLPVKEGGGYRWQVRVWDQDGNVSPWSQSASVSFETLRTGQPTPQWIAAHPDGAPSAQGREGVGEFREKTDPLPIFRREFRAENPVRRAVLLISGLGQYEARINGDPVTHSVLNPAWTDYRLTVPYDAYDVTSFLKKGWNALGVLLGNGMYNVEGQKGKYTKFIGSFGQPKLVARLIVTYKDNSVSTLETDRSWKWIDGPVRYSSTYAGEDFDARKEPLGWDKPTFDDSHWSSAAPVAGPGGILTRSNLAPIEVTSENLPVAVTEPKPGILVCDFGQNMSGWPKLLVRGRAGDCIKLIPGELLDANGLVTQRSANASPDSQISFSYTLSGSGEESWAPRFAATGFRYVQVEGAKYQTDGGSGSPVLLSIKTQFVHAAYPAVGSFECSSELLNRIHRLIRMAMLSNTMSVLTDCPHREKLGWLEQTHLAGSSLFYNFDLEKLYEKIAHDTRDSQLPDGLVPAIAPEFVKFIDRNGVSTPFRDTPEWGSASILSPWVAYQFSGNLQILEDQFETMRKYAAYLKSKSPNGIIAYGLGDWYDIGPNGPGYSQLTSNGLTATAIYYQDLQVLINTCKLLRKTEEQAEYSAEAAAVRSAFISKFFHFETNQFDRGSQTANAMPLALGLVPDDQREAVLDNLVADIRSHKNHVTAGDIGFHYVVRALTDGGRSDVLLDMLLRTDSPSYGFQLANGATTLTEAWDTNPDSSQNHFMLGHGEEWFYRGLAGIDFDLSRPQSHQIQIRPNFVGQISWAKATYDSVLGEIESSWSRKGAQIELTIRIPVGPGATVELPTSGAVREGTGPIENAAGVSEIHRTATGTRFRVGSGDYRFQFTLNMP